MITLNPETPIAMRRAMLSRNADSIYWMSRYMERAENVARMLSVHSGLLIDVGELAPTVQELTWRSVLQAMRVELPPPHDGSVALAERVMHTLTFDPDSPASLLNCLTRARENARGLREKISSEMWEAINKLYWSIRGEEAVERYRESPAALWGEMMLGSMLFQGLTDHTIVRDQRWHFAQLGKYLERIDITCRVIGTRYTMFAPAQVTLESPLRNVQWMAVLRTCCSIEAYRQAAGEIDPLQIASFLILSEDMPRSVLFCVSQAHEAARQIANETGRSSSSSAQKILGRLEASLRYPQDDEIGTMGLANYVARIQSQVAEAALATYEAYFPH